MCNNNLYLYCNPEEAKKKLFKSKQHKKVRLKSFDLMLNLCLIVFIIFNVCIYHVNGNISNRPPRFLIDGHPEIVLRLKEGAENPQGTLIYRLKGHDPDGDPLTFGLQNNFDRELLEIKPVSETEANIYLNKELDRETKSEYSIVLTLTDGHLGEGTFITQSLIILVDDINDNEPIFKPYQSALEVSENSEPGIITTVEATDRDEGAYGQVVYYMNELEDDNEYFKISTHNGKGVIRLVKPLDYERKNLYQLQVTASDRATQGNVKSGYIVIVVKVKDVEDQPPEFTSFTAVNRIPENVPIRTKVLQVKAVDGDRGVNNKIEYAITRGGNGLFAINPSNGIIYTTKPLDREDPRIQMNGAYIMEVSATEIGSRIKPPPSVHTEITIIVTDENDQVPKFSEESYEAEINENAPENTPITFLNNAKNKVFDYDQGKNGTFELFLEPKNNVFDVTPRQALNEAKFLIRVKNSTKIDYEKYRSVKFNVVAKEVGTNRFTSVPVMIHIRDVNDNIPEFPFPLYEITIPENIKEGTRIAQIKATDRDEGAFGTDGIRYTYLSGGIAHLLHLNNTTGEIFIKSNSGYAFDREVVARHYLTIEARDDFGQGNRNTVQMIINLLDVNDNYPIFKEKRYEMKLTENRLHFEKPLIVEARDGDLNGTANSNVTYTLVPGTYSDNFKMNAINGEITPNTPIDFEKFKDVKSNIHLIQLFAVAKDSGTPELSSTVPVKIYVQDENDNAPKFERNSYQVSIPEDTIGGTQILQTKATDLDKSSPNNMIVYRIQEGADDKFVIHPNTGVIAVAKGATLDPDLTEPKSDFYILKIIALDGGIGEHQLTASAEVRINITDINNKSPTIIDPGMIVVNEIRPVGSILLKIKATDLDSNAELLFSLDPELSEARNEESALIHSNDRSFVNTFQLNSKTGELILSKPLDREKIELYKLGIVVEDVKAINTKQYANAILTIVVEDSNDNNPTFRKPFYKRSLPENSLIGVPILNVVASDIDKNRSIMYDLDADPDIIDLVNIDRETGEMVVADRIDHEKYKWLNFTVRATDSGEPPRHSNVDVFLEVLDENDNPPIFIMDESNFTVRENAPKGTKITTLEAVDADSGEFGKITYLIDRISSQGKFSVDANTGILTVSDNLDRELKSSYMLVVEAWDNYQYRLPTGDSRNAFKQLYITIEDENDSKPQLIVPSACVSITEYHDPKEVITVIKAKDNDDPLLPNGQVEFAISGGNEDEIFVLEQQNEWNANLYAQKSLKNAYGNYTLRITASDLGTPRNIVYGNVSICVSDYNDHAPVFISPSQNATIRIAENATVGTAIIQVLAIDDDVGLNAAVQYRLKQDLMGHYRTFNIDPVTGDLTLKAGLDRERQKIYEIRVEAYDQGIPTPLSSELDLTIYVRNVNDYEPQFLVEEITANFTEHMKPGAEKVKLPDTVDKDEVDELDDPPSTVCYFIVMGNEKNIFHLDPRTHILSTQKELDREIIAVHNLIIKATEDCVNVPEPLVVSEVGKLSYDNETMDNIESATIRNISKISKEVDKFNRFKHSRNLGEDASVEEESIENLNAEQLNSGLFLLEDNSLVRIAVHVIDINDNAPAFTSKIFTGGITTAADFGSEFMTVKAIDKDEGINANVTYYQIGEIRKTLSEGLEHVPNPAFIVDRYSGVIKLNFDPQREMKGYFDFAVLVNDTAGFKDVAHVFIYLLREDQRVRFVLRHQPKDLRDKIETFRSTLSKELDAIVNVDSFKIHENRDGSVDKTKTDIYLHLVDRQDNSILEVGDVLRRIDQNIEILDKLFKDFNVLDTEPAEAVPLIGDLREKPMVVWLVFCNIFLACILVVTIILCYTQKASYKRQLRVAKVNAYGPALSDIGIPTEGVTTRVPNTNKHSMQGSNPIWLKAYANEWFKNDDDVNSPDSLDENIFTVDDFSTREKEKMKQMSANSYADQQNNLNSSFNVYCHIEKLAKKLETTEL